MRNILMLALASAKKRYLALSLTSFSLAVSLFLLLSVETIRHSTKSSFTRTVSGADLLIGARGSETGLLLHTLFHMGNASQNISWHSYEHISQMDDVAWALPFLMGDTHKGFKVIGTTGEFWDYYRYGDHIPLAFSQGAAFASGYEAVIGSQVAKKLGYHLGNSIVLAHGSTHISGHDHDDKPFTVVGILQPTGTAVDKSIYTSLEGIEALHVDYHAGRRMPIKRSAEAALHHHSEPESVTSILVGLKSRMMVLQMQRQINTYKKESLTALIPSRTANQLWQSLGNVEKVLRLIAILVVVAAVIGMLTMLLSTLNERRREIAILRSVGAHWYQIVSLFIIETVGVLLVATVVSIALLAAVHLSLSSWVLETYGVSWDLQLSMPIVILLVWVWLFALAITLIPAFRAYSRALHDGLQIKI